MKKALTLVVLVILQNSFVFGQGCAACRAQIEKANNEYFTVANGLNMGIYILMIVPYIILFFLFRKKIVSFFKSYSHIYKKK